MTILVFLSQSLTWWDLKSPLDQCQIIDTSHYQISWSDFYTWWEMLPTWWSNFIESPRRSCTKLKKRWHPVKKSLTSSPSSFFFKSDPGVLTKTETTQQVIERKLTGHQVSGGGGSGGGGGCETWTFYLTRKSRKLFRERHETLKWYLLPVDQNFITCIFNWVSVLLPSPITRESRCAATVVRFDIVNNGRKQ